MNRPEQKFNQDIEAIRIRIASPEEIMAWSYGEVIKPETINYRTQKPEKDGLFSERIFGPVKDWECSCGKYKKVRYRGIVCDRCGVEVTRKEVRRERMGHIKLASPCVHIWFFRSVPSRIGLLLNMSLISLERVVYYASWVVIGVNEEAKKKILDKIRSGSTKTSKGRTADASGRRQLAQALASAEEDIASLLPGRLLTESDFLRVERSYPGVAEIGTGVEAVARMLERCDMNQLKRKLEDEIERTTGPAKHKVMVRLRLVRSLLTARLRPEWMVMGALPVLPPDLRPMVALDGGRYASSDLNDLYRRVINRNNRLKRLLELKAPEVIVRNEKRMLQEAVDALLDNSMRKSSGVGMLGASRRPLRSLADILRGKSGRFRQNLLGKRVDYSGRSVIVVGPELKLSQCGIPKKMALELFKPFVMRKLIEKELAHNIRGAARLIEDASEAVWAALDEVIQDKLVLLNRAPTLHRLGIQAFRPKLIEGLAIQLHPLVCEAYNADFDGDQMAVHVPLSEEAQREARELMHSLKNLWKPSTGESIVGPFRDIAMGLFWLTTIRPGAKGEGKVLSSLEEAILAEHSGVVDIRAGIRLSREYLTLFEPSRSQTAEESSSPDPLERSVFVTSVGRLLLRRAMPKEVSLPNGQLASGGLRTITQRIIETCHDAEKIEEALDALKELGFWAASRSGISWGIEDLVVPGEKTKLLEEAHGRIRELERDVERGLMTEGEKKARAIEVWSSLKTKIEEIARNNLDPYGPVLPVVSSGARGRWDQLIQVIGMKGLVANPKGEVIELPILSSFVEGLNVLEYFISTHGARKGTADTALKTAAAGYLTRRLVEAGQEVIISTQDCGDARGWAISRARSKELRIPFWFRLFGRQVAATLKSPDGKRVVARKGELLTRERAQDVAEGGPDVIAVRSPLTCRANSGVCVACYGLDLGRLSRVELGTAVGIIAAQSIGEPGTQLTMRTFHIGGVAGAGDITAGLPRVEELFEARAPKNAAFLSAVDGEVVGIERSSDGITITIAKERARSKKSGTYQTLLGTGITPIVKMGEKVSAGDPLSEGPVNPKELFRYAGKERAARYLIDEVLRAYASQGVSIHDKHIEAIVRQMFSRVWVTSPNDSRFLPDATVNRKEFALERERLERLKGAELPTVEELLLGVTRVALTTPSVLAAASFQETTRVLVTAALEGRADKLEGLKENIIIGRLIPAGTGFHPPAA